jgi:2-haloacid dehalogenase
MIGDLRWRKIIASLPVLVFDVSGTLLDIEALTPHFARLFGDGRVMREWFGRLILYSQALSLAGEYVPFADLGGTVLKRRGNKYHQTMSDEDVRAVRRTMSALPCHPEVPEALRQLRDVGFRLFTLTNHHDEIATAQLERVGLSQFFE